MDRYKTIGHSSFISNQRLRFFVGEGWRGSYGFSTENQQKKEEGSKKLRRRREKKVAVVKHINRNFKKEIEYSFVLFI